MPHEIFTREEFEKALEQKIGRRLRQDMNRAVRQLERWDQYHASGHCTCPADEPHGVRLLSGDWGAERLQETDDAESYLVFAEETKERFGLPPDRRTEPRFRVR